MNTLKSLKPGEFFKRKATSDIVYVKGPYDRTDKKFECTKWEDANAWILLKGTTQVVVDFDF